MRFVRTVIAIVALTSLAATPLAVPAAPSGAPIVVGAVLSITGNYAPLGEPERNALLIAAKDINLHGGVAGRPIQFKIVDDEGKADTAQQLTTQLVGDHVAAIIGGSLTPTTAAMSRVTNDAKTLEIYMNPTDVLWNTKNGIMKYLFEATPRNELEARKLLAYIKTSLRGERIALVHDDAPYGSTGAAVVNAVAKSVGSNIVDDEAFPIAAIDLTAQIQKVIAAKADTILIWTASPAAPLLVRQAKQLGFKGNFVGSTGIASDNFIKVAANDGYGVKSDMNLNLIHPSPSQREFVLLYENAYKARPSNFASFAWDAAHLIALALNQTKGNTSGDALAAALIGLKPYAGTTGTFKFSATDHNGLGPDAVKMCELHGTWNVIE